MLAAGPKPQAAMCVHEKGPLWRAERSGDSWGNRVVRNGSPPPRRWRWRAHGRAPGNYPPARHSRQVHERWVAGAGLGQSMEAAWC